MILVVSRAVPGVWCLNCGAATSTPYTLLHLPPAAELAPWQLDTMCEDQRLVDDACPACYLDGAS